jgi:predicted pyridoxine 5'-phosphate oxidase superfamily flavin-nucleotide-binding protein
METKYQEKFGFPADRTAGKVKPAMAAWIQEFIKHSPFCVLATSNAHGDCDASPKGGKPGFVKVLNDKQLFIPDVAGNKQALPRLWEHRKQSESGVDILYPRS